jgi:phosphoribosylformimino-5-aminoimidazole carboxamide ribotide isomerase
VIVGTLALQQPELVKQAAQRYPGKVWVALDCRQGKVATAGWLEQSTVDAVTLAQDLEAGGVAGFIYTDILQDGTLQGPNIAELRRVAGEVAAPIIASGGIGSLTDLLSLLALESEGVVGAIVGQALYQNKIYLPDALKAVGNPRWQDVIETDVRFC